ncbi:hypothetical protein [Mechercharimyces sp. CAU 1602]|uniref:hypothetical protein n=1 Tax=Mechercharimyces sp. CAU 1602 TaxID=2973933 RepID=UPI002161C634|nr:hypothetical protein [Mechercharimyces sp. CAU 1602]MCS1352129.1 hypothetical protein [Mechercharimyces sp. CAU 1602]
MMGEQGVIQWMLQLIVADLEGMEESERPIQRIEAEDQGFQLVMKDTEVYVVQVSSKLTSTETEEEEAVQEYTDEEDVVRLTYEELHDLVGVLEQVTKFLHYDERRMGEVMVQTMEFPWESRAKRVQKMKVELQRILKVMEKKVGEEKNIEG